MLGRRTATLALVVCALGCTDEVRTCDLDTSSLLMWATVTDYGDRVEVEIELETPSAEALALCPDRDRLEVNGSEAELVRALGHLYYVVEFQDLAATYEITLERDEWASATAIVEMPPSFEITAPSEGSSHSRAATLDVSWTPAWPEGLIELAIADAIGSDCIDGLGVSYELEDLGSYTVAGNSLVSGGGGGSCEVTLGLTRRVIAEYPPALHEGGEVSASVRRRRPFTSVD